MRTSTFSFMSLTDSVTGTSYGSAFDSSQWVQGSCVTSITDNITGTFAIQGSNDPESILTQTSGNFAPIHWATLANTSMSFSGSGTQAVLLPQLAYKWMRGSWAYSAGSGSGALSAYFTVLGAN